MGTLFLARVLEKLEVVMRGVLLLEDRFRLRRLVSGCDPHGITNRLVRVPEECLSGIHISLIVLVQILHHILCQGARLWSPASLGWPLQRHFRFEGLFHFLLLLAFDVFGIVELWRHVTHAEVSRFIVLVPMLIRLLSLLLLLLTESFIIEQSWRQNRFAKHCLPLDWLSAFLLGDALHDAAATLIRVIQDCDPSIS